ncbi:energy transducer TonB [Flavobacterium pedocola]
MSKINIYETGWLNMVFEGRNKAYGAYQLRTENPKTTLRALFTALGLFASAAAIPLAISYFSPQGMARVEKPAHPDDPIVLVDLQPLKEEPLKEEKGPEIPEPVEEKTVKYTNMVVTEKKNVTEDVTTNKELENAQISTVTNEGKEPGGNALEPKPTGNTGGTGTTPSTNTLESTVTVDKQPQYPGGIAEFLKNVGKKFNTPEVENDAKTLKVLVYFVIEKDGSLSNIKVTRDPGYNLGKEALRVLNSMKTKWEPGYKNGEPVRTAYNLPIVINVQ